MHAGAHREGLRRRSPQSRYVGDTADAATAPATPTCDGRFRATLAREGVQHLARRAEDLDRHPTVGIRLQIVVDRRAVRRIGCLRLVLLEGGAVVAALEHNDGVARLEQVRIGSENRRRHLSERADVVDYPEAAAVRRNNEIIAVDLEVAH